MHCTCSIHLRCFFFFFVILRLEFFVVHETVSLTVNPFSVHGLKSRTILGEAIETYHFVKSSKLNITRNLEPYHSFGRWQDRYYFSIMLMLWCTVWMIDWRLKEERDEAKERNIICVDWYWVSGIYFDRFVRYDTRFKIMFGTDDIFFLYFTSLLLQLQFIINTVTFLLFCLRTYY